MRIINLERLLFAFALLAAVAMCPGAAFALEISGPDEISIGISNSYTVEGASGNVIWSATGNFGAGGGVSQSGVLEAKANACGAVTLTAYVDGTVATKDVRVSDSSNYYHVGSCSWSFSPPPPPPTMCLTHNNRSEQCNPGGRYMYSYSYSSNCCKVCYIGGPTCSGMDPGDFTDCAGGLCQGAGGSGCATDYPVWNKVILSMSYKEWKCTPKGYDIDDDNDGYNAYGSLNGPYDPNDNDENINPGVPEKCGDGIDNNGDGAVDEGCNPSPKMLPRPGSGGCPTKRVGASKAGECGEAPPSSIDEEERQAPPGGCRVAGLDMSEPVESPLAVEFIRGGSASALSADKGVTARAETVSGKVINFIRRLFEWKGN